jgi:D-alanyl-lipoteichoic acid acyltransferase DltB (MBOAT superfamily)
MTFNSLDFWLFFAAVFALHWLLPWPRARNLWLLAAGYAFYATFDVRFPALLAAVTAVSYVAGLRLGAPGDARGRVRRLAATLVVLLLPLLTYKFGGFLFGGVVAVAERAGWASSAPGWRLLLPVGLSFYTFQAMSYCIDVHRGRVRPTRRWDAHALYIAFFPQLLAGPIERAGRLVPQILGRRVLRWDAVQQGSYLVLWGLFQKCVVADNLDASVTAALASPAGLTGLAAWLTLYAAGLQLYADFSGYSDIARGLGKWLGFELSVNFNAPFFAANLTDFWRRWHITLADWFRDYVYQPLLWSRRGFRKVYTVPFVTLFLMGLWHGAQGTMVLTGLLLGVWVVLSVRSQALRGRAPAPAWRSFVDRLVVFHLVCAVLLLLRAPDVGAWWDLLWRAASAGGAGPAAAASARTLLLLGLPVLAVQYSQFRRKDVMAVLSWPVPVRAAFYVALVAGLLALGEDHAKEFLYFVF